MSNKTLVPDERPKLRATAERADEAIDLIEASEAPAERPAMRGGSDDHPVKRKITLRLDDDVLSWFRDHHAESRGYQVEINRVLRQHMVQVDRAGKRA